LLPHGLFHRFWLTKLRLPQRGVQYVGGGLNESPRG
jgi:hypothetical protein